MKVGIVLASSSSESVRHVMASVRGALAEGHELVFLHPSLPYVPAEEKHRLAGEFVQACDAIIGVVEPAVLEMRHRLGSTIPYCLLMLGTMPRGAFRFRQYIPRLTGNDALIVNCEADRRICGMFFANAAVPIVPLAYDDEAFYPIDDAERALVREELGIEERARVVLYAGRITPEKNLHAVLRVFRVLLEAEPDLTLVLAGRVIAVPFPLFGVSPTAFPETLAAVATKLGIPPERVLYAGPVPRSELRELYNIADLTLNLTLHHDENFGLAQVEAMACGSPVVGSMWGGLKDTIEDGRTGHRVSTVTTPLGVKVDWWEAANRSLAILRDPEAAARFRVEGPRHAADRFSRQRMREGLAGVLRERVAAASAAPEPLRITDFGREFWEVCDPDADRRAPFRRGERSMRLYREMITPFTGLTGTAVPADEPLRPDQALYLAVAIAGSAGEGFWPDDPIYPLECVPPAGQAAAFQSVRAAFRTVPVITFERLSEWLSTVPGWRPALEWMVASGIVLRSNEPPGWLEHGMVPREVGEVLFEFRRLPADGADFVVSD